MTRDELSDRERAYIVQACSFSYGMAVAALDLSVGGCDYLGRRMVYAGALYLGALTDSRRFVANRQVDTRATAR